MAEKARLFFTTLLRRNLFQAAAAFIVVIRGESKQKGTGGWILCAAFEEMSCSWLQRERGGVAAAQPRAAAQRAVQGELGERLGETLPKMKGLLLNEAMTNWWLLEKETGASKGSQNSFVYKTCK